jgi:hypothetical protein
MANIRVWASNGGITVRINGQDYSAEAFEATPSPEMGITTSEAATVQEKIESLREWDNN